MKECFFISAAAAAASAMGKSDYLPKGPQDDDVGEWNAYEFEDQCQYSQERYGKIKHVPIGREVAVGA